MPVLLAPSGTGLSRAIVDEAGGGRVTTALAGVRVNCVAAAPKRPNRMYAVSQHHGVFRSNDHGVTWQPAGLEGMNVKSVACSPHDPETVYAGLKPAGLWKSTDGGESWFELDGFARARRWFWLSPAEPPDLRAYVISVAVSPEDHDVVIAGVEAGAVVRSIDGGLTWSRHRRSADRDCHSLTFHASSGAWVYQAGGGGPAFSRDAGESWRHPVKGLEGRYSMSCCADPGRPEIWYVAASPAAVFPRLWRMPIAHYDGEAHCSIYRSTGGAPWEKLKGGLPQPLDHMAYGLQTDWRQPGHVYAGLSNGRLWRSRDYGDSWEELPLRLPRVSGQLLIA